MLVGSHLDSNHHSECRSFIAASKRCVLMLIILKVCYWSSSHGTVLQEFHCSDRLMNKGRASFFVFPPMAYVFSAFCLGVKAVVRLCLVSLRVLLWDGKNNKQSIV